MTLALLFLPPLFPRRREVGAFEGGMKSKTHFVWEAVDEQGYGSGFLNKVRHYDEMSTRWSTIRFGLPGAEGIETRSIVLAVGFPNTIFAACGWFGWLDRRVSLICANLFRVCVIVVSMRHFLSPESSS